MKAWRALRGEFMTQFVREVRKELNRRGKGLSVGVPQGDVIGPPYGNMKLDWRAWVREGLIDRLVVGVRSGNWHYPSMRGKDRERGYLASGDEGFGLLPRGEAIEDIYAPLCRKHNVSVQSRVLNASSLANARAYGVVPDIPALTFAHGRLSVEAWIKTAAKQDYGRVISQYDHTLPHDSGRGWEIYVEDDGQVVFRLNDGTRDFVLKTDRKVPVGKWTHLVCASEGADGQMKAYLDGTLDEVIIAAPGAIRKIPVGLFIGGYPTGGRPFDGWIAEIRVSGVAREIESVLTAPLQADADTLLLWQPKRGTRSLDSVGTISARLRLPNVSVWEPGPVKGLTAMRLGVRSPRP